MLRECLLVLLVATVYGRRIDLDEEWQHFKIYYKKQYSPQEEINRRAIWENNVDLISRHNLQADVGLHSYTLGQNKYADMSHEEFKALLTSFKQSTPALKPMKYLLNGTNVKLPETVDWRDKGYVTGVKDQAACGACWAFSATGSLEGQHFRKTGELISLSEQNLVDCSRNGNLGCDGGNMALAFEYIRLNNGIDTEESYPYVAKQEICKFRRNFVAATVAGFAAVIPGSESALKSAVALEGPISVGMDASPLTFMLYKSGVYSDPACSSDYLDHAVTAVGYGTLEGKEYWLLKNSWGTTWGDEGYVMMARNAGNMCGVATQAFLPIV